MFVNRKRGRIMLNPEISLCKMIIYKIENKADGKIYVGQTRRTLAERISEHKRKNRKLSYIYRAINKYGIDAFDITILEICDTLERLNEREKFWIKELNCKIPIGYNMTDGGLGRVVTDEERSHKSASQKGHIVSEETRKKISQANKGKSHIVSEETRKKMSEMSAVKHPVRCLETGRTFDSVTAAAKWCGVQCGTVRMSCRKSTRTGGGYHWEYVN